MSEEPTTHLVAIIYNNDDDDDDRCLSHPHCPLSSSLFFPFFGMCCVVLFVFQWPFWPPGPKDVALEKVVMKKDFSALGGTWAVSPKYKVGGDADVSVGYVVDNTAIKIDTAGKTLTVAHSFSQGTDTIAPTVNMAGDVSLSYTRQLDKGQIKTTYTPDDSVSVQWSDGVYETTFKAPLSGYYKTNSGIKINMKRTVEL